MDPFLPNLLCNDEVIEINQDPLGKQASRVYKNEDLEVWESLPISSLPKLLLMALS